MSRPCFETISPFSVSAIVASPIAVRLVEPFVAGATPHGEIELGRTNRSWLHPCNVCMTAR